MACISLPVAVLAGGALAAGGSVAASALSPGAPPSPKYAKIAQQTLQGQISMAPAQYSAEANPDYGQPAYAGLQLQNLMTLLNGTPAGTQSVTSQAQAGVKGWYGPDGAFLGNDKTAQPVPGAQWAKAGGFYNTTTSQDRAAMPGLNDLMAGQATSQRASDIADVQNLGPSAAQAMLAADPYNATLLAKLNTQANQGLDAGSGLTPDEQRAMQQQSRAAFAARGMGGSNGALSDELLKQFSLGQQLLTQRQQFAQSLVGTNQAVIGDPFLQITGRNSGAVQQAQQSQSQSGPQIFNPQAGLGLASSNYATQTQFAAANNPLSSLGGILGGVGQLTGGLASAYRNN